MNEYYGYVSGSTPTETTSYAYTNPTTQPLPPPPSIGSDSVILAANFESSSGGGGYLGVYPNSGFVTNNTTYPPPPHYHHPAPPIPHLADQQFAYMSNGGHVNVLSAAQTVPNNMMNDHRESTIDLLRK